MCIYERNSKILMSFRLHQPGHQQCRENDTLKQNHERSCRTTFDKVIYSLTDAANTSILQTHLAKNYVDKVNVILSLLNDKTTTTKYHLY